MRIAEIQSPKPKTPEQSRVDSLQATAKQAQAAVKTEKAKQSATKAQKDLAQASKPASQQLSFKPTPS
jgi:hypothetical protein